MGFEKCIILHIYHYNTIQNNFTALQVLLCFTYEPFLPPHNPLATIDLLTVSVRFAFSRMFLRYFFLLSILEREEGGRKRGRETLIGCLLHASQPGTEPTTQACALTGN